METHARTILVGLFSILVIAIGFVFVYWLKNTGRFADHVAYQIRYEGSVSGLRPGAAVLFNGIRVGSVTSLRLDTNDPNIVLATIDVERSTPVRSDTRAGIDFQGLLGAASVSLTGGTGSERPRPAPGGEAPVLTADPLASRDLSASARETLQQIEKLVTDNADPLHQTLTNLGDFSGALARNSGRVDTILSGIERMTGGGSATPPAPVFGLSAPKAVTLAQIPTEQLVVADPVVPVVLDTQKILVDEPNGNGAPSEEGQWADSLPKLVQSKIIETFENAGYLRVGRPVDALATDRQLLLEIRKFEVSPAPEPTAQIAITAKIVIGGMIEDAKIFRESVPVTERGHAAAAAALDKAFGQLAADLVTWAAEVR
jgi:phospholipid/cholesterol/gamma-HCH transport system substrate-binding protein